MCVFMVVWYSFFKNSLSQIESVTFGYLFEGYLLHLSFTEVWVFYFSALVRVEFKVLMCAVDNKKRPESSECFTLTVENYAMNGWEIL